MRISTELPIDSTARRVTGKGIHYNSKKKKVNWHSPIRPRIREIDNQMRGCKGFEDLTGRSFGRMTVIGLSEVGSGRWIVRCSCGEYEQRRAKAIKNTENWGDRCQECLHLAYLKRRDEWKQNGENTRDHRSW